MTWTNPDPWHCYQCGADGLGGREAGDHHDRTTHAPKPKNPKPIGSVVPEGIDSAVMPILATLARHACTADNWEQTDALIRRLVMEIKAAIRAREEKP